MTSIGFIHDFSRPLQTKKKKKKKGKKKDLQQILRVRYLLALQCIFGALNSKVLAGEESIGDIVRRSECGLGTRESLLGAARPDYDEQQKRLFICIEGDLAFA